jgi:proteasome lid subunit RPN8/RPN11
VRQRNAKSGPPPPLQIGKLFPDDQAILWAPVEGLARSMELAQPAIVITQGALREVIRHLSSSPDQELLGFLLGEPCECPKTKRRFLCITGTLRTGHAIAEEDPIQIPDAEWLGQQLEVRRRRSTLIGWYHSAPYLSPAPPALDLASHRARFTEAWQCGLVISTEGNEPAGGFFRAHADPAEGGAYVPFYEQVDDDGILEGGRLRTLIDWTSYSTSELVERDEDERSVHLVSGRRADSDAPDTPAAALPLMIPSPADDPVSATAFRSRWVGSGIVMIIALAVVFVAVQIWDSRRLPEPPMAALPRQRELVVLPNAGAIAAQRRLDSLASAAMAAAAAAQPNESTTVATTTSAAGAAASAPAAPIAQPSAPPVAPPVTPETTPAAPAPIAPIPSEIRIAAQSRFDSLADSLEHGLHNYHDRRVDFGQKRLSCKELAYGYRAADEALVGLARLAGDTRTLDPQRKSRYNQLIAGMDTVNDDFDASKCKRF